MGIFDKKQKIENPGNQQKSRFAKREDKKPDSVFGRKSHISREEFKRRLKDHSAFRVSGLIEKERMDLEKELFGKNREYYLDKWDIRKGLDALRKQKYQAKTQIEREKTERKIKLLESFLAS